MQRVNSKDQHIAQLKRPPKEDWRAKLHKNERDVVLPPPPAPANAPFLPEVNRGRQLTLSNLVTLSIFAQAVTNNAVPMPQYSNTYVNKP